MTARWLVVIAIAAVGCGRRNFNDPDAAAACPASYARIPGIGPTWSEPKPPASWVSARSSCLAEGGHLAVPLSQLEALALVEHGGGDLLWVGISQLELPGTWTTVAGVPATFLPWDAQSNEPDGSGPCARLEPDAELSDVDCQQTFAFVCECRE